MLLLFPALTIYNELILCLKGEHFHERYWLILKNARENKEYTQKQVMELTGIHRKSLSGYENNVAEPDLSTFATLANLYGISADEALEIGEPDPSVSLLRFEFQVLSLFKELDAKHQEELLIQITALVRYLNAKNMVPQNHQSR